VFSIIALGPILSLSIADTITIAGVETEGVYVTESATRYVIANPTDGSTTSVPKEGITVTLSEDREAILALWKDQRGIPAQDNATDYRKPPTSEDKVLPSDAKKQEEKEPIEIVHHGNAVPDVDFRAQQHEQRQQRIAAEQYRKWAASPEGQKELAKEQYNKQGESQSKILETMWTKYGIPADKASKPLITNSRDAQLYLRNR
jgi:hypothetical protein